MLNKLKVTFSVGLEFHLQKQPPRCVPRKRYSENIQQIYRRHPCRSAISIKLLCNFLETTLRHGFSPINLLHIFRTPFLKNTSGWLLLHLIVCFCWFSNASQYMFGLHRLNFFFFKYLHCGCLLHFFIFERRKKKICYDQVQF